MSVQFSELTRLIGKELRDDSKLPGSVDLERVAASVVVGDVETVGVPPTTGLVADTLRAAFRTNALVETGLVACMRCNMRSSRVCFPDVKLVTTRTSAVNVAL